MCDYACVTDFLFVKKKEIAYRPANPTTANMILVTDSRPAPKILEIKSYLKKPTRPQLIAPIMISARVRFLKDITPFIEYFHRVFCPKFLKI